MIVSKKICLASVLVCLFHSISFAAALPDHSPRWINKYSGHWVDYGLTDLDNFVSPGFLYCQIGTWIDCDMEDPGDVVTLNFNDLTVEPWNESNTDLFVLISKRGGLDDEIRPYYTATDSQARRWLDRDTEWSNGSVTFVPPYNDMRYDLFRYYHFSNYLKDEISDRRITEATDMRKCVILIHGWNRTSDDHAYDYDEEFDQRRFYYLRNILIDKLTESEWKLITYHWERDADTGGIFNLQQQVGTQNGTAAAEAAHLHGQHLGELLDCIAPNLEKIHFIAHSAGSWAARSSTRYLLNNNSSVEVQITLLDPYMPNTIGWIDSELGKPIMDQIDSIDGNDRLYRLENYYSDDTHLFQATEERFEWRVKDINRCVGASNLSFIRSVYGDHGGPISFYLETVDDPLGTVVESELSFPDIIETDPSCGQGWAESMFYNEVLGLNIESNPSGAVITVSLTDENGNKNGTTPITREFGRGSNVVLTAPSTIGNRSFRRWLVDGESTSNRSVSLTINRSIHAIAMYNEDIQVGIKPPENLQAEALSHDKIKLTWTDNGTNLADQFLIGRATSPSDNPVDWRWLSTVDVGNEQYTDDSLMSDTRYYYLLHPVTEQGVYRDIYATTNTKTLAASSSDVGVAIHYNQIELTFNKTDKNKYTSSSVNLGTFEQFGEIPVRFTVVNLEGEEIGWRYDIHNTNDVDGLAVNHLISEGTSRNFILLLNANDTGHFSGEVVVQWSPSRLTGIARALARVYMTIPFEFTIAPRQGEGPRLIQMSIPDNGAIARGTGRFEFLFVFNMSMDLFDIYRNLYADYIEAGNEPAITLKNDSTGRYLTMNDWHGVFGPTATSVSFNWADITPGHYTLTMHDEYFYSASGARFDGEWNGGLPTGDGIQGGDMVYSFRVESVPTPSTPILYFGDDTGRDSHDGITAKESPKIYIRSDSPTELVHIYIDDTFSGDATKVTSQIVPLPGDYWMYTFAPQELRNGSQKITARASVNGVEGASSPYLNLVFDNIPPDKPLAPQFLDAADTPPIGDHITSIQKAVFEGIVEAGTQVLLYIDDELKDSRWLHSNQTEYLIQLTAELDYGFHYAQVELIDLAGNRSERSDLFDFTIAKTFTLDSISSNGGSVTTPGEGVLNYLSGDLVEIIAEPEECYHFVGWTGTGVEAGAVEDPNSSSTKIHMVDNYNIVANYELISFTLIASSTDGGSVSIPGEGAFNYNCGTNVEIRAKADEGFVFVEWTGNGVTEGKVLDFTSENTRVDMDSNCEVIATFVERHTLIKTFIKEDAVEVGPKEQTDYNHNEIVSLIAPDISNYVFKEWTGSAVEAGVVEDPSSPNTTVTVDADYNVIANYTVIEQGGGGNGGGSGGGGGGCSMITYGNSPKSIIGYLLPYLIAGIGYLLIRKCNRKIIEIE